jgi:NAD(P)-dependent dehydrogenase (short-subunit alcohol dehydrogenase family)
VNLAGAAAAAHAVLPGMLAAKRGTIINISSGAAHRPLPGWSAYCAAKAGLAMLTRALAADYAEAGIRVFGFAPGLVDTDLQGTIRASGVGPVAKVPRESLASPRDPAQAIAFLASKAGDAFAGQELDIRNVEFRAAAGLAPLAA